MITQFESLIKDETYNRLIEVEEIFDNTKFTDHEYGLIQVLADFDNPVITLQDLELEVKEIYTRAMDRLLEEVGIHFNEDAIIPFQRKCTYFVGIYSSLQEDNLYHILRVLTQSEIEDDEENTELNSLYDILSDCTDIEFVNVLNDVDRFDFVALLDSIKDIVSDEEEEEDVDIDHELVTYKRDIFKINPGCKLGKHAFISNNGKVLHPIKLTILNYKELAAYLDNKKHTLFALELAGLMVNCIEEPYPEAIRECFQEVLEYLTLEPMDRINILKGYNTVKFID